MARGSWPRRLSAAGVVVGVGLVGTAVGIDAAILDGWLGGFGLLTAGGGAVGLYVHRPRRPQYPHLGRFQAAWVRAGAGPEQLRLLDDAHRLRALTPPVGYGDRRTLVDPLADAFEIVTSPARRDPWLVDHQLVIDPVAEAHEIIVFLHRVTGLISEARVQLARLPPGPAREAYRAHEHALLDALDGGLRRARALTTYRDEVRRLTEVLRGVQAMTEVEGFGERVADLVSETARHQIGQRYLEESRRQLQLVEEGLREVTRTLDDRPTLPSTPTR